MTREGLQRSHFDATGGLPTAQHVRCANENGFANYLKISGNVNFNSARVVYV